MLTAKEQIPMDNTLLLNGSGNPGAGDDGTAPDDGEDQEHRQNHHRHHDQQQQQQEEEQEPDPAKKFSWVDPHTHFVVILVGPEELPFSIQKDFLCAKSRHYRWHFAELEQSGAEQPLENVLRLPDISAYTFGLVQNWMYTGYVYPEDKELPSYEALIGVWRVAERLVIDDLGEKVADAMVEVRRLTQRIPGPALIIEIWNESTRGSSLRELVLTWIQEYLRISPARETLVQSLPREVLSDLVIKMAMEPAPGAGENAATARPMAAAAGMAAETAAAGTADADADAGADRPQSPPLSLSNSGAGYLEGSDYEGPRPGRPGRPGPRRGRRKPAIVPTTTAGVKKPRGKPGPKPGSRRKPAPAAPEMTTEKKLSFCADLVTRMLTGPGFWTRLTGPFKQPVDPERDGVLDYFDKIDKPMDLGTVKAKADRGEYADENEFVADVRQIFTNCYTYWGEDTPVYDACRRLEETFESKFSQLDKWVIKKDHADEGQKGAGMA